MWRRRCRRPTEEEMTGTVQSLSWQGAPTQTFVCCCFLGTRCKDPVAGAASTCLTFFDVNFSMEFSPNKQSCLKISCVLRFQARPHPGWREKGSVPYHVPRPSPVALHCSLVDGPGFETRCCRSCPTGHDVYKGQRTVTQLRLSPSRNFVGRLSCQIGH